MKTMREFTSVPDWDCEQGQAIPASEWDRAGSLVGRLFGHAPLPTVSPCGDGSIHLYFRSRDNAKLVTLEMRGDETCGLNRIGTRRREAHARQPMKPSICCSGFMRAAHQTRSDVPRRRLRREG
jgi:hypothetical protein